MDSIPHAQLIAAEFKVSRGKFQVSGFQFQVRLVICGQATLANLAGYFAITADKREILTCLVNLKLET